MADFAADVIAARKLPSNTEQALALGQALQGLPAFSAHLRSLRQEVVRRMHEEDGMSWADVADAIGVKRTRAAQIARGIAGGSKKKAPPE